MRSNTPARLSRLGHLRHESVVKGTSVVIVLSLTLVVAFPTVLPYCLCVAGGAGLSYLASRFLFDPIP